MCGRTGCAQGLVRIMKKSDETPPPFDLDSLMRPQPYKVRVYVLEGKGLQPKDLNGKSDPYIKVWKRAPAAPAFVCACSGVTLVLRANLFCCRYTQTAQARQEDAVRPQARAGAYQRPRVLPLLRDGNGAAGCVAPSRRLEHAATALGSHGRARVGCCHTHRSVPAVD